MNLFDGGDYLPPDSRQGSPFVPATRRLSDKPGRVKRSGFLLPAHCINGSAASPSANLRSASQIFAWCQLRSLSFVTVVPIFPSYARLAGSLRLARTCVHGTQASRMDHGDRRSGFFSGFRLWAIGAMAYGLGDSCRVTFDYAHDTAIPPQRQKFFGR